MTHESSQSQAGAFRCQVSIFSTGEYLANVDVSPPSPAPGQKKMLDFSYLLSNKFSHSSWKKAPTCGLTLA
jgi:hypothetical protein